MLGAKRMDEIEGFLIHCSHMHIQSFTPKPCTCFSISLFIHLAATPHAFLAFPLHSPFNQHMHPLTKKSFIPHTPKTPPEIIIAVGTYPISDFHSTSLHMHLHKSTHAFTCISFIISNLAFPFFNPIQPLNHSTTFTHRPFTFVP